LLYIVFAQNILIQVDEVAAGLLAFGVRPGDRVGVWGPNVPEWLLLQFATARAGAIMVNVNPAYRPAELQFTLAKVIILNLFLNATRAYIRPIFVYFSHIHLLEYYPNIQH
jgi:acyl-CoA synthetase (AMP-forming)/AMP-acid ligase II